MSFRDRARDARAPRKDAGSEELEQLNVEIPKELKRRFRIACFEDERQMREVVAELVEGWLDERAGKPR